MSYVFTKHIISTDVGVVLFHLKTTLITAGWIVKSSSDGTTFNTTGDQITSPNAGAGGFSNLNAWIRIQMPSVNGIVRELTFQRTASTTYTFKYSFSAKFTTGGSATATPTATDQQSISGSTGNDTVHIIANTLAPYNFAAMGYPNGNANSGNGFGILFEAMMTNSGPIGDIDPYVMGASGFLSASLQNSSNIFCWFNKGTPNEFWGVVNPSGINTGSNSLFPGGSNIEIVSGKMKIAPIFWSRPIGSISSNGLKGAGVTLWWNGLRMLEGDNLTVSTPRDRICHGEANLPWDGTITLIR